MLTSLACKDTRHCVVSASRQLENYCLDVALLQPGPIESIEFGGFLDFALGHRGILNNERNILYSKIHSYFRDTQWKNVFLFCVQKLYLSVFCSKTSSWRNGHNLYFHYFSCDSPFKLSSVNSAPSLFLSFSKNTSELWPRCSHQSY